MKMKMPAAALLALLLAVPALSARAKSMSILDCYRLLVREKKIADVLTNMQGTWLYRPSISGETLATKGQPVVDVKNGYIRLAYEIRGTRTGQELAYFVSEDNRDFVAVSDDSVFMEGRSYEFRFYACDNDRLVETNPFTVKLTYRDFLGGAGIGEVEKLTGGNDSLCVVAYQLPRLGTSVMAVLRGAPTDIVGNDQRKMEEINAVIKNYRAYSRIELAWDMQKAVFVVKRKIK